MKPRAKIFKLKKENAEKIRNMFGFLNYKETIDLNDISFKKERLSKPEIISEDESILISFVDADYIAVMENKVLGKSDEEFDRLAQSLVSRLIYKAALFESLPKEDLGGEEGADSQNEGQPEEKSSERDNSAASRESLEEELLQLAKNENQEVSDQPDALSSGWDEELPENLETIKNQDTGDKDKTGSSQYPSDTSENSAEACNSAEPVGGMQGSQTTTNPKGTGAGQSPQLNKEIKKKLNDIKKRLEDEYAFTCNPEEAIKEANKVINKVKQLNIKSKTIQKLLKKTEKSLSKLEDEISPKERTETIRVARRDFNLPYCYQPENDDWLSDLPTTYKKYLNNKQSKRIKQFFKKLLDEIGLEESPRIDKKKLVLNLAKYKSPYSSYKNETEKSYLLLLLDLSGSMLDFHDLVYPVYAISKEHENIICILNRNSTPFAVVQDGKVARVEVFDIDKNVDFYQELIKNYHIEKVISVSDWDGVSTYQMMMEKMKGVKWIWLDPYCCNVCNYIPQREKSDKYLPDEIKPFKKNISYWYAVGDIEGFITVLESEF